MAAMTNIPEFPPKRRRRQTYSRTVLFVAFEGMGLLDLTGSTTVFWSASLFMKQQGKLGYSPYAVRDCHEISVSSYGTIRTNCIVPFSVERVGTNIDLCDLLFLHLGSWRVGVGVEFVP